MVVIAVKKQLQDLMILNHKKIELTYFNKVYSFCQPFVTAFTFKYSLAVTQKGESIDSPCQS